MMSSTIRSYTFGSADFQAVLKTTAEHRAEALRVFDALVKSLRSILIRP